MTRLLLPLVAVLGAAYLLWTAFAPSANETRLPGDGSFQAQAQEGEVDTSGIAEMTMGEVDAPVEIVEYASFTCPHCATFHEGAFENLKADYVDTGRASFTFREVYFDRYGLWASMIARCGGEARFFGIADMLFAEQGDWTEGEPAEIAENLKRIGLKAGLSREEVDACLTDSETADALVARYQEYAERDGVRSTPSFLIDGELYSNMSYAEFREVLETRLADG